MSEDPQVQVVVFNSSTPGYFFNHSDLAQAADFAAQPAADAVPATVDSSCG